LHAYRNDLTLREAAVSLGHLTAEEFDRLADPAAMLGPED
jgi:fumarate hydratase class II